MAAVSPALAERLADATADLYLEAERLMLERIARSLAQGIDAPGWAEKKLLELQLLRAQTQRTISSLEQAMPGLVDEAIRTAWNRGSAVAAADLAGLLGGKISDFVDPLPGRAALDRLVAETVGLVRGTHPRILRWQDDVYRQVIASATPQVLLGTVTRAQAAQAALDRFAARGVTGFVDRAGRGWAMDSYTEMAVRTGAGRAAVAAHSNRLVAHGIDLVIVSDVPGECETCRPWEGKILSLTGGTVGGVMDGHKVTVDGTLAEAEGAGLYHPGCRHSHSGYLPGVTRPMTDTADPEGDTDRQQLRYLERQTRAWKRREAVALTDDAAKKARTRVSDYQARIREHVDRTGLLRQRRREQIGAAH